MKLLYRRGNIENIYDGELLAVAKSNEIPSGIAKDLMVKENYPAFNKSIKFDRFILRLVNGYILIIPNNPKYTKILKEE